MRGTTSAGRGRGRLGWAGITLTAAILLVACSSGSGGAARAAVEPPRTSPATAAPKVAAQTPDCSNVTRTPAQTEGPYFKAGSPERTSLIDPGMAGTPITITGFVVDLNCQPVAGALLDFWQADSRGNYDTSGYTLRGHQFTDENGAYHLETIVPGLYPGRTRHIHVKVQLPGRPALTTQLYFPDEPANTRDGIFQPQVVIAVQQNADGRMSGSFTFMVSGG
jgi:protocatechuate 3,4-dioxygenase beta subunit